MSTHNKHGSSRPQIGGKKLPIYGRPQTAGGSPFKNDANKRGELEPPPGWGGTEPEWLVYNALSRGLHLTDGYGGDFTYQTRLSTTGGLTGRLELQGLIADFLLPMRRLVLQVVSEFYHYRDVWTITREQQNAANLAGMGYFTVWMDSDDLSRNAIYFTKEALELRDHSKLAAGQA